MEDHYETLQIARDCSLDEIKQQYRALLLKYHPDKGEITVRNGSDLIPKIQRLYQTLIDPLKREKYDLELSRVVTEIDPNGLDEYDLDEFDYEEGKFMKICPRCQVLNGVVLDEAELELNPVQLDSSGEIIVQCQHCSLWIKVVYVDQGE